MFDTIHLKGGNQSVHFNSVAGTLVKSTEKSKIKRFHMNSKLAETFFDVDQPYREVPGKWGKEKLPIIVLQVMLCGNGEFLVEFLDDIVEGGDQ